MSLLELTEVYWSHKVSEYRERPVLVNLSQTKTVTPYTLPDRPVYHDGKRSDAAMPVIKVTRILFGESDESLYYIYVIEHFSTIAERIRAPQ